MRNPQRIVDSAYLRYQAGGKVDRQAEAMKAQQHRIEDLTGRVIRLETQLELLTGAAIVRKIKGDT